MSLFKKISAAAAASVMTLSLASCGKDTTWGAVIDGEQLRAGILIYFQSNAVSEANQYLAEGETDVLNITIEDKPSKEWINDKAVEDMREYVAVEKKYDELGLSMDENDKKALSNGVDQWWDEYIGDYFEGIGVSRQSYYDAALNTRKRSEIFDYYYAEGGELAVPEEDVKNYLTENNARIKFISMPLKDGEGNLLKSEGKAELKEKAQGYIERIKGGESFEAVEDEYNEYYASLAEAAAGTEEQEADETAGETDAAADGSEAEETERVSYGTIITKDSTTPSQKAAEKAWELNVGDCVLVEDDDNEYYYIVYRIDLFADDTYLDTQKSSVLHALKDEEFDASVSSWTEGQTVELNDAAFDRYKLEKLTAE